MFIQVSTTWELPYTPRAIDRSRKRFQPYVMKSLKQLIHKTNTRTLFQTWLTFENIGSVYRSSDTYNLKFIASWIMFVYVWLRFERIFSHLRALKWKMLVRLYRFPKDVNDKLINLLTLLNINVIFQKKS